MQRQENEGVIRRLSRSQYPADGAADIFKPGQIYRLADLPSQPVCYVGADQRLSAFRKSALNLPARLECKHVGVNADIHRVPRSRIIKRRHENRRGSSNAWDAAHLIQIGCFQMARTV